MNLGIDTLSFWTFTDIFEEGGFDSLPFDQKFGLITIENVAKPGHLALQLMHRLEDDIVLMQTQSETVDVLATMSQPQPGTNMTHVVVLVVNYNRHGLPIVAQDVHIEFSYGSRKPRTMPSSVDFFYSLDSTHSNAVAAWRKMGSPAYPTAEQIASLKQAAVLVNQPKPLTPSTSRPNTYALDIAQMEAQSVAVFGFWYAF